MAKNEYKKDAPEQKAEPFVQIPSTSQIHNLNRLERHFLYKHTYTMFTNVLTKATVLALAAIGSSSATPLEARNDFSEKMLEATNWWRAQHGANPVSWDQSLADAATDWANQCQMRHSVRSSHTFTLTHKRRRPLLYTVVKLHGTNSEFSLAARRPWRKPGLGGYLGRLPGLLGQPLGQGARRL